MDIFEAGNIKIINCDMFDFEGLPSLKSNSINAVITDFPYGTLNKRNVWDKVIDYDKFWNEINRIRFETTPIISTAQMPFTAYLISTNYEDFKYTLVWEKSKATGYLNAKKQPMRAHEDIVVRLVGLADELGFLALLVDQGLDRHGGAHQEPGGIAPGQLGNHRRKMELYHSGVYRPIRAG